MTDKEIKDYLCELLKKYDYYEPYNERFLFLKLAGIKGYTILDVGTGKGYAAIIAAKRFECDVMGIDKSKKKLILAKENATKERIIDKIKFVEKDITNMSFNDSFDAVACFNCLHAIRKQDRQKAIGNMFRVAKQKVLIAELNDKGIKLFDNYLYPKQNHAKMKVDLLWLENQLCKYAKLKKYERKVMNYYVCKKEVKK